MIEMEKWNNIYKEFSSSPETSDNVKGAQQKDNCKKFKKCLFIRAEEKIIFKFVELYTKFETEMEISRKSKSVYHKQCRKYSPYLKTVSDEHCDTLDTADYMIFFVQLVDGATISEFLKSDKCCKLADRYLLAMIFTYFIRAEFSPHEFTAFNFFLALHLAHDVEEDNEELKHEIITYTFGNDICLEKYRYFMKKRDELWKRINFRALVSLQCCLKVIHLQPHHAIWQRFRAEVHAGADRGYMSRHMQGKSEMNDICWQCNKFKRAVEAVETKNL